MEDKNENVKRIISIFLWILFVTPTIFNLIHHCDSHNHIGCKEIKAHLHQTQKDCKVCDFNLLTFHYTISKELNIERNEIFVVLDNFFIFSNFHLFSFEDTQLRAPPIFS